MDDDEHEASTSKLQRRNSAHDASDDRDHDDQLTNSESCESHTHSERSRKIVVEELANAGINRATTSAKTGVLESVPERKSTRRRRETGRVEKRHHSVVRRSRRAPKRRPRMREERKRNSNKRHPSASTIISQMSSRSGIRTPICKDCGHRCCSRRRYEDERRRYRRKVTKRKRVRFKRKPVIIREPETSGTQCLQAGSRCQMLSPLFINTNMTLADEETEPMKFSVVTPEMIYESLKTLTMWKSTVETTILTEHIMRNYPVNPVITELMKELREKLEIAAIAGMVIHTSYDHWCLSSALLRRKLNNDHVTLFWIIYADTLKPVQRREIQGTQESEIGSPTTFKTNTSKSDVVGS